METRQHFLLEAENPCLWRGFLLSDAPVDCVFGLRRLLGKCRSVLGLHHG
ncbi:hypothetical protein SynSYN20_01457 [Synechococcus sp. SYN20]|nr:hypothetical protein SynSYN20_01457 [Synechococcus sp. SYN20]